ncbi:unnamed protein product [Protopolystoma xenopodis]|uniref:Translation initiation factor eIF2B subunit delta n=1 Tax=Protopolystoma xenopodis TaxID=117903 RepID=A0A448WUH7_9PLAT|nr:unnamed protein product [Protopolystoma xenopodis]
MLSEIDEFVRERIVLAGRAIESRAASSIRPGECVAIFGYSSLVSRILIHTWRLAQMVRLEKLTVSIPLKGYCFSYYHMFSMFLIYILNSATTTTTPGDSRTLSLTSGQPRTSMTQGEFSVLVVDSGPHFEGRRMLFELTQAGIPCEYTHLGAIPLLASKISLLLLGAHALLNNGYVLSRIGTAQLANIVSRISQAPVLVCAETYKFWDRAQSDAFEYNELADPDAIWKSSNEGLLAESDSKQV